MMTVTVGGGSTFEQVDQRFLVKSEIITGSLQWALVGRHLELDERYVRSMLALSGMGHVTAVVTRQQPLDIYSWPSTATETVARSLDSASI